MLIGIICSIGFAVLDVPYGLVLGVLAGFLEFVPLVGPVLVAVLAAFLASTQSGALMGLTVLFLAVLRVVQDYVIYPRLVASGMKLHPLAIIITLLCGAHLAGVAGLFLAIPAAAVLMVSYRYFLLQLGEESLLAALVRPEPEPLTAPLQVTTPTGVHVVQAPTGALSGVTRGGGRQRRGGADLGGACCWSRPGRTCSSPARAPRRWPCWKGTVPDVLLSDLAMPEMDGLDLDPAHPGPAARTGRHRSRPPRSPAIRRRRIGPAAWPPAFRSTSPSPSTPKG